MESTYMNAAGIQKKRELRSQNHELNLALFPLQL